MAKGISLHIGLNRVDSAAYPGYVIPDLWGCENDAHDMRQIADSLGYQSTVLLNNEATADRLTTFLGQAAEKCQARDIVFISYSGHGSQIPDVNGDEADGQDETWVLYDRMFIDDELYQLWSMFKGGVRIILLSDSCHSGTMSKDILLRNLSQAGPVESQYRSLCAGSRSAPAPVRFRLLPNELALRFYQQRKVMYDARQWAAPKGKRTLVAASVILISGCQDNQESADGVGNGLFTQRLKEVWRNGAFSGNYESFWRAIADTMPPTQSPNYSTVGAANPAFEMLKPFIIDGAGATPTVTSKPSVEGPQSVLRSGPPPEFQIHMGTNPYYIFEVTNRPELFDSLGHEPERNWNNFYATWDDPNMASRLTSSTFVLPQQAWERLRDNAKLYFRIGTTSSRANWDNYTVSTGDLDGTSAPQLEIRADGNGGPSIGDPMVTLSGSVGQGGANQRDDVRAVQDLLNRVPLEDGGPNPPLVVDGFVGTHTINAIRDFQNQQFGFADGRVDPGGQTLQRLNEFASRGLPEPLACR